MKRPQTLSKLIDFDIMFFSKLTKNCQMTCFTFYLSVMPVFIFVLNQACHQVVSYFLFATQRTVHSTFRAIEMSQFYFFMTTRICWSVDAIRCVKFKLMPNCYFYAVNYLSFLEQNCLFFLFNADISLECCYWSMVCFRMQTM